MSKKSGGVELERKYDCLVALHMIIAQRSTLFTSNTSTIQVNERSFGEREIRIVSGHEISEGHG